MQFAPGGPVERMIAQLTGTDAGATARFSGGGGDFAGERGHGSMPGEWRARRRNIAARRGSTRNSSSSLEKQFGFDKPAYERFC